jgi:hypothetical protein
MTTPIGPRGAAALCAGWLLLGVLPAQAGMIDFLRVDAPATDNALFCKTERQQRSWDLRQFTTIQLVPIERGAPPNQHPVSLDAELLRQQLVQMQTPVDGTAQPLFGADEAGELAGPLAQALKSAGPGDDVQLLSTSRRGENVLVSRVASPPGCSRRMAS